MDSDEQKASRLARAQQRRVTMPGEIVAPGSWKGASYADSTPEERLAAATRLIGYHEELRGRARPLPRSEWPGEVFVCGSGHG